MENLTKLKIWRIWKDEIENLTKLAIIENLDKMEKQTDTILIELTKIDEFDKSRRKEKIDF